jgi:hypothetical protein
LQEKWIEDLSDLVDVDDDVEIEFNREPPDGKVRVVIDASCMGGHSGSDARGTGRHGRADEILLRSTADSEISWRQDVVDTDMATEQEVVELAE